MVGDAFNAIHQFRNVKVYEQTEGIIAEAQVGQDLGAVKRNSFFDGFQLNHHLIFSQNIEAITCIYRQAFVYDWEGLLSGVSDTPEFQFVRKCSFICRFQ